jgi:glycosyltransferase involved in cell wall biosynthesis
MVLNMPSIDVVIPLYNGALYIEDTITSVLTQTHLPERIIVVNDGSTDDGPSIVQRLASTSLVPITLLTKQNGGLSSARNAGITASTASYIAFLDADDKWLPEKLETQLYVFEHTPTVGAVYCQCELIDESGTILSTPVIQIDPAFQGSIFEKLLGKNSIVSSASGILIRRDIFEHTGGFDETLTSYEDWDMWLRIAHYAEFGYAPTTLVQIRQHPHNMQKNIARMLTNEITLYNKWCALLPISQIPTLWKDSLALSVAVGAPQILPLLQKVNRDLSPQARCAIFGIYRSIVIYFPIYILKKAIQKIIS